MMLGQGTRLGESLHRRTYLYKVLYRYHVWSILGHLRPAHRYLELFVVGNGLLKSPVQQLDSLLVFAFFQETDLWKGLKTCVCGNLYLWLTFQGRL